tara:strand:+ start:21143 stop:21994 length:852 start_codon:yes stop_codon:yes gene_type:complete
MKLAELRVANNEPITWGSRTYVMGIINVTPDSFSGDGLYLDYDSTLKQALRFVEEGADFIDIGAESTRPQHIPIGTEEELDRIMPVIQGLIKEINLPLSIDTSKSLVALEALKAGAHIINDVSGLTLDTNMASIVADWGCPVVIMHNDQILETSDALSEVRKSLQARIQIALDAGVRKDDIIIDPGIGFGKSPDHNLSIINHLPSINPSNFPILIGTSRKSTIGHILKANVDDRIEGTAATVAVSIARGADIVRVHDVQQMQRVCLMTDAITRSWRPPDWKNP